MALSAGDILFTSLITDDGTAGATAIDVSFSFVATTNISAGEVISFHAPEAIGDATFTYTVGTNGLAAADIITIGVPNTGTPVIIQESIAAGAGGSSLSGISFTGTQTTFDMASSDNIIAGSAGNAIAAHTNDDTGAPLDNAGVTGLNTASIGSAAVDLNQGSLTDDNGIWQGGPFTVANISDPSNWFLSSNTTPDPAADHDTGDLDGTGSASPTYASQAAATPCFAPGTLIATEKGEAAVETLKIGDMLRTAQGGLVPVKWIGRVTANKLRAGPAMEPVRFEAGSLGGGLPRTELIVTADHGMILDDLVINASALVNGGSIHFLPLSVLPMRVVYYHVETEAHDVILANGAPAETFIDYAGRQAFDNYGEYVELDGAERIIPEMDRPRISARRLVPEAIRARLGIAEETSDWDAALSA